MGPTGCYFRPLCHQPRLLVAHWQQYYSTGWPSAHFALLSSGLSQETWWMCFTQDYNGKLLCVDGYSVHKGKGVHLFLLSLLMCTHVSVFYFLCVQLTWLEKVEGANFTDWLNGSFGCLEMVLNCIYLQISAPGDPLSWRV